MTFFAPAYNGSSDIHSQILRVKEAGRIFGKER